MALRLHQRHVMTDEEFEKEVIERSRSKPVLVDFWAPWCGACRVLSPQLEVIHNRHREEWVLVKVNADKNPVLSTRYHVAAIPSVKLFLKGKIVNEFAGALPGHVIEKWIERSIKEEIR